MVDKEQIATVEVRQISAAETVPLRHAVLRPGRPLETALFAGDELPSTTHFGAFRNRQLLCVASLYEAELPDQPGVAAIQLRGMATAAEAQRTGLGRALVLGCVAFARAKRARLLWCNARVYACAFYSKLGFEIVGDEFDIPDVGPHYRMKLELQ
jgi:Predicted acyltransferase